jgi:hypothetical protein
VGRVDLGGNPCQKWISKSSSPVPEKIRGVLNNIPDILVKVRGSGVKFRFWTPFWQGKVLIFISRQPLNRFGPSLVNLIS